MRKQASSREQLSQFMTKTLRSAAAVAISTAAIGCGWSSSQIVGHSSNCGTASCTSEEACSETFGIVNLRDSEAPTDSEDAPTSVPAPKPPAVDEPAKSFPGQPEASLDAILPIGHRVDVEMHQHSPGDAADTSRPEQLNHNAIQPGSSDQAPAEAGKQAELNTVWYGNDPFQSIRSNTTEGVAYPSDFAAKVAATKKPNPFEVESKRAALRKIRELRTRKARSNTTGKKLASSKVKPAADQLETANPVDESRMPEIPESILRVSLPGSRQTTPRQETGTRRVQTAQRSKVINALAERSGGGAIRDTAAPTTVNRSDSTPHQRVANLMGSKQRWNLQRNAAPTGISLIAGFVSTDQVPAHTEMPSERTHIEPMFEPIGHFETMPVSKTLPPINPPTEVSPVQPLQDSSSATLSFSESLKARSQSGAIKLNPVLNFNDGAFKWKRIR